MASAMSFQPPPTTMTRSMSFSSSSNNIKDVDIHIKPNRHNSISLSRQKITQANSGARSRAGSCDFALLSKSSNVKNQNIKDVKPFIEPDVENTQAKVLQYTQRVQSRREEKIGKIKELFKDKNFEKSTGLNESEFAAYKEEILGKDGHGGLINLFEHETTLEDVNVLYTSLTDIRKLRVELAEHEKTAKQDNYEKALKILCEDLKFDKKRAETFLEKYKGSTSSLHQVKTVLQGIAQKLEKQLANVPNGDGMKWENDEKLHEFIRAFSQARQAIIKSDHYAAAKLEEIDYTLISKSFEEVKNIPSQVQTHPQDLIITPPPPKLADAVGVPSSGDHEHSHSSNAPSTVGLNMKIDGDEDDNENDKLQLHSNPETGLNIDNAGIPIPSNVV